MHGSVCVLTHELCVGSAGQRCVMGVGVYVWGGGGGAAQGFSCVRGFSRVQVLLNQLVGLEVQQSVKQGNKRATPGRNGMETAARRSWHS